MDSTVQPVPDQKTLVLVNTFVGQCAQLLNVFSAICEQKLNAISSKIRRMDATLSLLEAKLRSINGLERDSMEPAAADFPDESDSGTAAAGPSSPVASDRGIRPDATPPPFMAKDDPRYARFFKMLSVGVPIQGVKNQMQLEGLIPDLLETPEAPAPA